MSTKTTPEMQTFKVGDKVHYLSNSSRIGEIAAMLGDYVWINECGAPCTYLTSALRHILPTPPEGRDVEEEKRHGHRGDQYWNDTDKGAETARLTETIAKMAKAWGGDVMNVDALCQIAAEKSAEIARLQQREAGRQLLPK
jgi:hypothetical protein